MSSFFILFCFIKTISRSDKYISETALYRIDNDVDAFREITFKGFTSSSESLVSSLEKNSIALMIGRYVYEENTEYIALIQTIPVLFSDTECVLTSSDLLYSLLLLLFSAPIVQGSYCPDNEGGRESFILTRRLYNGVTNNKHVPSNVIVSYANKNNWYNAIKNNLQKTGLLVIGRLKIGSSRVPHIVTSNIEWTYLINELQSSSSSSKEKLRSREELDTQLDNIEKKYATLSSYSVSVNFLNIVSQVCLNEHPPECNNMNPMPQTTEQNNLSNTSTCTVPSSDTRNDVDTSANNCDPVISVSTTLPLSQDKNTKQAKKGLRPLLPLKK
ncbi:hypothetical protein F8M41_022434 [Gigaspora margarita]|uniref:Uncharacterized protein n=1 Tax=Gigaspora margarita TaxID=4874 RepID=A0A8H4AF06_GIGMA|nr:hypothetical protein F8M41_022434 [Gigaspora margarita]